MGVVIVPLAHLRQHLFISLRRSPLLQLPAAAARTFFRGSRQKNLDRGIRQHHRADVPAVHHHIVFPRQLPLHFQQVRPHRRMGGDRGGIQGNLRQADLFRHVLPVQRHMLKAVLPVGQADLQLRQKGGNRLPVSGIHTFCIGPIADGAVNGAGIHIEIPQRSGNAFCQCAFSGAGGAVDGDTDGFQ